jgi:elongation factor 2
VNIEQREVLTIVEGEIPAAETLDLSEKMRGATAGRAVRNTYFKLWQAVPTDEPALGAGGADQEAQEPPSRAAKASEFIDNE